MRSPGISRALLLALALSASPAWACESGHWVSSVSDDGGVVTLEDGSVWLVNAVDQIDTALWLPTTEITACSDKLINTEDGEVAVTRRVR